MACCQYIITAKTNDLVPHRGNIQYSPPICETGGKHRTKFLNGLTIWSAGRHQASLANHQKLSSTTTLALNLIKNTELRKKRI